MQKRAPVESVPCRSGCASHTRHSGGVGVRKTSITLCIITYLCNIPNPGCRNRMRSCHTKYPLSLTQSLIARLFHNFQVPDLNARHGKVGDLELDVDGDASIENLVWWM